MSYIKAVGVIGALIVALALSGCASRQAAPLPSHDSTTPVYGKFVWYDLLTEDLQGVKRFYGELLGWTFENTGYPNYTLIKHRGRSIGGIVDMAAIGHDDNESQWVSLLSVADVDRAAEATEKSGGEVHVEPVDLPGYGRLAIVSDPQGALLAFLRSSRGDPPDREATPGDWMWTELWTGDVDGSSEFYRDLVGYELDEKVILEDIEYSVFTRDDVPRAGIIPRPIEDVRANWLPYVRVEDPASLADRVEGLGGKVLLDPRKEARKGTVAIVIDPSGAALALQQWEEGA